MWDRDVARRSRQNIDRRKGGNFVAVLCWLPVELQKAAKKTAKARGVTVKDLVVDALTAFVAPVETPAP